MKHRRPRLALLLRCYLLVNCCTSLADAVRQQILYPKPLHVVLDAQCAEHTYRAPLDATVRSTRTRRRARNTDEIAEDEAKAGEINMRYVECPGLVADGQEPKAILLYAGNEGDIWSYVNNTGFVFELGATLGAEVLFHEHRFYGKSVPIFPNPTYKNVSSWWHLSAAQRVAYYNTYLNFDATLNDFNYFITGVRKRLGTSNGSEKNFRPRKIPVIVIGGSYGGTLAFWLRARFPEQFAGAIASSAPLLDFPGYIGNLQRCNNLFDRVVTQSFDRESSKCRQVIAQMWGDFEIISNKYSSRELNDIFHTCQDDDEEAGKNDAVDGSDNATVYNRRRKSPIQTNTISAAIKISRYIRDAITYATMINYPFAWNFLSNLPPRPVRAICDALMESYDSEGDEFLRLKSYANILQAYFNSSGTYDGKCLGNLDVLKNASEQWNFQACTQFISPFCNDGQTDFFPASSWSAEQFVDNCRHDLGDVANIPFDPFYNWREFGPLPQLLSKISNVILSNGLNDPWSPFGLSPMWFRRYARSSASGDVHYLLHSQSFDRPSTAVGVGPYDTVKVGIIPEQSLFAIQISNGAHHEDLVGNIAMAYSSRDDEEEDDNLQHPQAVDSAPVLYARILETSIVRQWIAAEG